VLKNLQSVGDSLAAGVPPGTTGTMVNLALNISIANQLKCCSCFHKVYMHRCQVLSESIDRCFYVSVV